MSKNFLEVVGQIVLFRDKENPIGTAERLNGVSMDFDGGSGFSLERVIENDAEMVKGSELATEVWAAKETAKGTLKQTRVKPDFLNFVLAYFFGVCSSSLVGTAAVEHNISPNYDTPEHPSFTAIQRRGNSIIKERFAGNHINSFTLDVAGSWCSLSAEILGWGKRAVNYDHEDVSAPADSTQITLADSVAGTTAAERLESVYRVRAKADGADAWSLPGVSAVSTGTPAVLDLVTPVGVGTGNIDFHVDYIPTESYWFTLPAKLAGGEPPLKIADARIIMDGFYDGSDIVGGVSLGGDFLAFSITGNNNIEIRQIPDGSGMIYAGESTRGARAITIKLTEKFKTSIRQYQADHPDSESIAVALRIRGAEIDSGYYYGADIIFPKCAIMGAPVVVNGRMLATEGDLVVMDDGTYNGVIVKGYNKVASYLA